MIDRLMMRFIVWFVRTRYRTQLRIAAGATLGVVLLGGYLIARRNPPEG